MTIFLESPWAWVIAGGIVEIVLFVFYRVATMQGADDGDGSGSDKVRRALLAAMGLMLLVTVGGVVGERLTVTPREEVIATLGDACQAFESNDPIEVKRFIATSQRDILSRVDLYMGMVEFTDVRMRQIRVEVNPDTSPMTAKVRCFGVAWFRSRGGLTLPYEQYAATFHLSMVREPNGWKVEEIAGDPQKPIGQ